MAGAIPASNKQSFQSSQTRRKEPVIQATRPPLSFGHPSPGPPLKVEPTRAFLLPGEPDVSRGQGQETTTQPSRVAIDNGQVQSCDHSQPSGGSEVLGNSLLSQPYPTSVSHPALLYPNATPPPPTWRELIKNSPAAVSRHLAQEGGNTCYHSPYPQASIAPLGRKGD